MRSESDSFFLPGVAGGAVARPLNVANAIPGVLCLRRSIAPGMNGNFFPSGT